MHRQHTQKSEDSLLVSIDVKKPISKQEGKDVARNRGQKKKKQNTMKGM